MSKRRTGGMKRNKRGLKLPGLGDPPVSPLPAPEDPTTPVVLLPGGGMAAPTPTAGVGVGVEPGGSSVDTEVEIENILSKMKFRNEAARKRYAGFLQFKAGLGDMSQYTLAQYKATFDLGPSLGSGIGGEVYRDVHRESGQQVARKVIRLEIKPKARKQINLELQILHKCASPYVVGFYGSFVDESEIHVIMELMDCGSLESVMKRVGRAPETICREIARMAIEGLVLLLEEHKLVHRDIKPQNILMNSAGEVKLCDFGISAELNSSLAAADTFIGTTSYMAPERIDGVGAFQNCDVWSIGVTMIELATGTFPIPARGADLPIVAIRRPTDPAPSTRADNPPQSMFDLLAAIIDDEPPILPPNIDLFSAEFQDFIKQCCAKDPKRRPTQQQMLTHPWLTAEHPPADVEAWCRSMMGGVGSVGAAAP